MAKNDFSVFWLLSLYYIFRGIQMFTDIEWSLFVSKYNINIKGTVTVLFYKQNI